MAIDGSGSLWWADTDRGLLASLTPGTNQIITYTQSLALTPKMLTISDGLVWFSAQDKVGVLLTRLERPAALQLFSPRVRLSPKNAPPWLRLLPPPSPPAPVKPPGQTSPYPFTFQPGWLAGLPTPHRGIYLGYRCPGRALSGWSTRAARVLAKLPKQTESQVFLPLIVK